MYTCNPKQVHEQSKTKEAIKKWKCQYSWPPCTNQFRSVAFGNANIVYFSTYQASLMSVPWVSYGVCFWTFCEHFWMDCGCTCIRLMLILNMSFFKYHSFASLSVAKASLFVWRLHNYPETVASFICGYKV